MSLQNERSLPSEPGYRTSQTESLFCEEPWGSSAQTMVKFVLHPKAFCADQNATHRTEGIAQSGKHLPCKHNDPSPTPTTRIKSQSMVVSAEKRERQAGPWGLLASQISEPLPSERLCLNTSRWTAPEEQHPRLTSGLHTHASAYTYAVTCTC